MDELLAYLKSKESKYSETLNALDQMQQSMVYAARKKALRSAEQIIVRLEQENNQLNEQVAKLQKRWHSEQGAKT